MKKLLLFLLAAAGCSLVAYVLFQRSSGRLQPMRGTPDRWPDVPRKPALGTETLGEADPAAGRSAAGDHPESGPMPAGDPAAGAAGRPAAGSGTRERNPSRVAKASPARKSSAPKVAAPKKPSASRTGGTSKSARDTTKATPPSAPRSA